MSSALVMSRLTSRMTGASDARSFSCWTSASNASSSTRVSTSPIDLALRRLAGAVEPLERRVELVGNRDHAAARRGRSPSRTRRSCTRRSGRPSRARASASSSRSGSARASRRKRAEHALLENRKLGIARPRRPAAAQAARQAPRRRRAARPRRASPAARRASRRTPAAGAARVRASAASSLPRSMRISPRRFTGSGIDGTGRGEGRSIRGPRSSSLSLPAEASDR